MFHARRVLGLAVLTVILLAANGCSTTADGEDQPGISARQEVVQKDAPIQESAHEEAELVTATLTYFDESGVQKTMKVPYLPAGQKIATIETSKGTMKVALWEDKAPNTVINFAHLANSGRYDGVEFHRVIAGFMAQTGDVEHKGGFGGPGYSIPAEFDDSLTHVRGVVSMARSTDPDSAGSQFFIMLAAAPHLDGKYTAFGEVIEGLDVIDEIKKGTGGNGALDDPDTIIRLRVESVTAE
jgi:cyclophilin family peptidyl-prolyl cis-trans isomerase